MDPISRLKNQKNKLILEKIYVIRYVRRHQTLTTFIRKIFVNKCNQLILAKETTYSDLNPTTIPA